ncbi:MAG TPA: DEAD/DEAH box helicase family protein [Pyrinomonadaceae bacterium]|nr:DEAD/DEAH box helicase family protein [Pyrinomonadaceae bacterium]
MRFALFDFQETALENLRAKLNAARSLASSDSPQAVSFSAPTGSGKTVVMTALFEDIFFGNLDLPSQPNAAILWISDMPELNEQSRLKMESASNKIRTGQLIQIDANFDAKVLEGGNIYFLNTQKLGTDKLLTKKGDNRTYPIWETLTNTARTIPDRFYVVIDEAHRGMRGNEATKSRTIMQKFLLGSESDGLSKMPVVIGMSATPKRFEDLLSGTDHTVHKVYVKPDDVRESGLLKDRVLIDFPETQKNAEMTMASIAATRWTELQSKWDAYCKKEQEPIVDPILVIQVEDGTDKVLTKTNLADVLASIESKLGRKFRDGEIAHNFNEVGNFYVGIYNLRRIEAARIQDTVGVKVVVFKMSLSTGWDCPRAEVLMSFRRASDATYIAQLLGRMIRTPLARRIASDESLNDVHLFLPHFDQATVEDIIKKLTEGEDVPPTEIGTSRELITLKRRDGTEEIFEALKPLVTYRVGKVRKQSNMRRFMALSRNLTHDELNKEAMDSAKKTLVSKMQSEVKRLKDSGELEKRSEEFEQISIQRLSAEYGSSEAADHGTYTVEAVSADIDRRFAQAGRVFGNGLHMDYWRSQGDREADEVKIEVLVLAGDDESVRNLEKIAESGFNDLYNQNRSKIRDVKELKRTRYERLRLAAHTPTDIPWDLPEKIDFRRGKDDPEFEKHLYVEDDGTFRTKLGSWEKAVLEIELAKREVVGWLRNPVKKDWSLEIPYKNGGIDTPMFPDLVIVRQVSSDFEIDILEPHDPSRNDNHQKAKGYAEFAGKHGDLFGRIQMIRKSQTGSFVRLNFNDDSIRVKTLTIESDQQLTKLFETDGTVNG